MRPLIYSVAISDLFLCLSSFYAAAAFYGKHSFSGAFGFFLIAVAAFFGVLRYSISHETFVGVNQTLASFAGHIGLPLVGFAFIEDRIPVSTAPFVTGVLLVLSLYVQARHDDFAEDYSTIMGVLGQICIIGSGLIGYTPPFETLGGSLMIIVGGIVIGTHETQTILGIRKVNLFHYCFGISNILLVLAFQKRR